MEKLRRIYNPVQKDYATFLVTSEESNGERTLLEVELAPGGGNGLHYHLDFSEGFEVLEGELNMQVGTEQFALKVGDRALAHPNTLHRFFSTSDKPTRFLVESRPGHSGFENALRILYGLAEDGHVSDDGSPKEFLTLAYLVHISGTKLSGKLAVLQPVIGVFARMAQNRGIDQRLAKEYLRPF